MRTTFNLFAITVAITIAEFIAIGTGIEIVLTVGLAVSKVKI